MCKKYTSCNNPLIVTLQVIWFFQYSIKLRSVGCLFVSYIFQPGIIPEPEWQLSNYFVKRVNQVKQRDYRCIHMGVAESRYVK